MTIDEWYSLGSELWLLSSNEEVVLSLYSPAENWSWYEWLALIGVYSYLDRSLQE